MRSISRILNGGLFALAAVFCLAPTSLRADVIINDTFDDGGRTDGADPLDAEWYRAWLTAPTTGFSVTVGGDSGGLGSDNALIVDSEHTQDYIVANLPADVTLNNAGEFIRLSFNVRLTNMCNYRDTFRFGLFNSGANKVDADEVNTASLGDDYGYAVCMATGTTADVRERITRNPGGSTGSGSLFRISGGSGATAVESLQIVDPAKHIIKDNAPHSVVVTLTRSTTGSLLVRWDFDGELALAVEDTPTVPPFDPPTVPDPYFTFNEIGFGTVVSTTASHPPDAKIPLDYIVDDVKVETGTVPACEVIPPVYVRTGIGIGHETVTVAGIASSATQVNVYADGVQIGTAALASPAPASVVVNLTSPLAAGQELSAKQVIGGIESCFPSPVKPVVSPTPLVDLVTDGFGDGDRDNDGNLDGGTADDPLDQGAPFYLASAVGSQFVTVVHDTATAPDVPLTTGNVLKVNASGGAGAENYQVVSFPNVSLDAEGDFIKVSFDFRATTRFMDRNVFRFGLFTSNGIIPTGDLADPNEVYGKHEGYFSTIANYPGQHQQLYRGQADNGTYMSLDLPLGQATPATYLIVDLKPHKLALTVARTAAGVLLTYEVDGLPPLMIAQTTAPVYNFDEFGIGSIRTDVPPEPNDFVMDNVKIIAAGNPCSAAVFDDNKDDKVGAADLAAFNICYTGPTPPLDVFNTRSWPCRCMDINKDNAIDQQDFGVFQACFTGDGEYVTVDSACDDYE